MVRHVHLHLHGLADDSLSSAIRSGARLRASAPDARDESFAKLDRSLAHRKGVRDPKALAAWIGREHGKIKDADVRIVYYKLLGGWYVVRGPHQTPISGRFPTKEAAQAWLARK